MEELEFCMHCGEPELCIMFPSDALECSACEARHYPYNGERLVQPWSTGRQALEDAEARLP